jgi:hypothetical protein
VDPNTTLKDLRGLVQQAFSEDAELVSLNRLITRPSQCPLSR